MSIPVTFTSRDGADHFRVAVRVAAVATPVERPRAAVALVRLVPGEHDRVRLIGMPRRPRPRLERRQLESFRLGL